MISAVRSILPFTFGTRTAAVPSRAFVATPLGIDSSGAPFMPVALNDSGDLIVATCCPREGLYESHLTRAGRCERISGATLSHSPILAVSRDGRLAGGIGHPMRAIRAWASHLGLFGERHWPDAMSVARAINAHGQVAGDVFFDGGEFLLTRGFVTSRTGAARFLIPPHGGTTSARALNDRGDLAFNATPLGAALDETRAWLLRDDCYHAISTLGGRRTWAHALTPAGRVAGRSQTASGATHAFLWEEGRTIDLGSLDDCRSEALAANDDPVVVGRLIDSAGVRRAFWWTPSRRLRLLDDDVDLPRGCTLTEAVALNAQGLIAAHGLRHGRPLAFLLTPRAAE